MDPLYKAVQARPHWLLTHWEHSTDRSHRSVAPVALVQPSWSTNFVCWNWSGLTK